MSVIPDTLYHRGGVPVDGMQAWDAGNIYFVIETDHPQYDSFMTQRQTGSYANDGSNMVHSTIQSALNATVTQRNDYVVIVPASVWSYTYDITTSLTMTKDRVHLVCPSNFGTGGMIQSPVINIQDADYDAVTLSGNDCEIAGLFFMGYRGKDIIGIDADVLGAHIHDNFIGVSATENSENNGIHMAGTANFFNIHHNHFTNYLPGNMTSTDNEVNAFIYVSASSSTRGIIAHNTFCTGNNTEVGRGISIGGSDMLIDGNVLWETAAIPSVTETGTLTVGIYAEGLNGLITNNRIGTSDPSKAIVGGTAINCINNYSSLDGGTICS